MYATGKMQNLTKRNWKSMGWPHEFVWQRRCSVLFSPLMFIPVFLAILTRNKRHCSRFRNSMSLACWS